MKPPQGTLTRAVTLAISWLSALNLACCVSSRADEIRFSTDIRPILAEHCLHCHGHDEAQLQGDLRLDTREGAIRHAIQPNHSSQSELIARVTSDDDSLRMPPPETGKRLTPAQIEMLRKWIDQGAPYEEHWAFRPIATHTPPDTKEQASTDIDRFIVAQLEQNGMKLSPSVDQRTWIRRATYDLHGLPPTSEEINAFLEDQSPDARAKVIDRLLESPRYGQRWGRYWLDIARYADTHGGAAIGFTKFPFSYTYRDYVIDAFNRDVPYDRFIHEQLAADQLGLPDNDPSLAGLGYLTVGMQYRSRHDLIDDQIDVVSRGLMGLTVACARCHDHKYDPIPTAEYYGLYAALASSRPPKELPTVGVPADSEAYRAYQAELQRRQRSAADAGRDQTSVMQSRLRMQVGLYLRELAKGTPEQDLSAAFLSYRTDDVRPLVLNRWRDYLRTMPEDDPVFGPWVQLSRIESTQFSERLSELRRRMDEENGDPSKFAEPHALGTATPKWNPLVVKVLRDSQATDLLAIADAYGKLFSETHKKWLQSMIDATIEAESPDKIIPDEDPRHAEINSPIYQQLRHHLYHDGTPTVMPPDIAAGLLNRTIQDNFRGKEGAIEGLHLESPGSPPRSMVLKESDNAGPFYLFRRGNPIDRGPEIEPGFLSIASKIQPVRFPAIHRRLELARRITEPANPLTRRVIVNWVWQRHFGEGLVRTPDDFGTRGDSPTHPELLDYLANEFLKEGWSIKKLHRRILLTDVYRQAAVENRDYRKLDPENRLLWRMPLRRLDMESMRDALLMVSMELDDSQRGRPFDLSTQPAIPRRSIYAFINRDIVSNFSSTFDGANPNACTAKRPDTTVPQQTLYALNSEFIQDRADSLARKSFEHAADKSDEGRIAWMMQRAWGRVPKADELEKMITFLRGGLDQRPAEGWPQQRWNRLAHVLLASNEFMFID
jgi:hypothetical protein